MLNADKYIDRLRVIVKSADELEKHLDKTNFILYRVKDVIKDYDEDFDNSMEEMERSEVVREKKKLNEMFNIRKGKRNVETN